MKRSSPPRLVATLIVLTLGVFHVVLALGQVWLVFTIFRVLAGLAGFAMLLGALGIFAGRPRAQELTRTGLLVITPLVVVIALIGMLLALAELRRGAHEPFVVALGVVAFAAAHVYAYLRLGSRDVGEYLWQRTDDRLGKSQLELELDALADEDDHTEAVSEKDEHVAIAESYR